MRRLRPLAVVALLAVIALAVFVVLREPTRREADSSTRIPGPVHLEHATETAPAARDTAPSDSRPRRARGTSSEGASPPVGTTSGQLAEDDPTAAKWLELEILSAGDDRPLRGLLVELTSTSAEGAGTLRGRTDERGRFASQYLRSTPSALVLRSDGYEPYGFALRTLVSDRVEKTIRLRSIAEVRGVVVDPEGRPEPGARIVGHALGDSSRTRPRSVTSDSDGGFVLGGLSTGAWSIVAFAQDFVGRAPIEIDVPTSATITLALRRACTARVRITRPDGEPVVGAIVEVELGDDPGLRSRTSSDGLAVLLGLAGDDRDSVILRVTATRKDGTTSSATRSAEIAELCEAETTILLDDRGEVSGVVIDGAKEPVGDAEVSIEGPERRSLRTTASGRFTLRGLSAGEYTINATTALSGVSEPLDVKVDGLAPIDLVLTLSAGEHRIAGRVIGADGEPLALAPVTLLRERTVWRTTTRNDGTYEFGGLPSGADYRIEVRTPTGDSIASMPAEAGTGDLVLEMPALGSLTGIVAFDGSGDDIELRLIPADEPVSGGVTPLVYRFSSHSPWISIRSLPAGRYRAVVLRGGISSGRAEPIEVAPGRAGTPIWIDVDSER
jgi:hypothetical protein